MSATGDDQNQFPARHIVARGPRAVLEYAIRADGTMEAKEWLQSQDESIRSSFSVLFDRLVNHGPLFPNKEQFKKMQGLGIDGIWEFKRGGEQGNRIFCIEIGNNRWLLTNHYQKGGSKKDQSRAAKRAATIADEHLERELAFEERQHDA